MYRDDQNDDGGASGSLLAGTSSQNLQLEGRNMHLQQFVHMIGMNFS